MAEGSAEASTAPPATDFMDTNDNEAHPGSHAPPSEVRDEGADPPPFRLLDLPLELISAVLGQLAGPELAQSARACRALRALARDEVLWQRQVAGLQLLAETGRHGHAPFGSWREFYAAHYPYWFLARRRIWVGDGLTGQKFIGQLVLARYDHRMGAIEAYRLRATNARSAGQTFLQWDYDPTVIIHLFSVRVELLADDPVARLEPGSYPPGGGRLTREIPLLGGPERAAMNRRSRLMLARAFPDDKWSGAGGPAVWPPHIVPATARVRAESPSLFRDPAHKPQRLEEVCDTAFRTRTWCEFMGLNVLPLNGLRGASMGEEVTTFSSLPLDCYTPTADKPYQGIWVGDYSGHGAEFLLLTQKSAEEAAAIPPIRDMADDHHIRNYILGESRPRWQSRADEAGTKEVPPGPDPPGCSGRLEAIKLTGDPNVPCGQYTFIAEDLGRGGFVRVAREAPFVGARIVRSWGHVASRGFTEDGYIRAQLIMVSHDCLAQYWEEFGHISYFKRIDIDKFLDVDATNSCFTD